VLLVAAIAAACTSAPTAPASRAPLGPTASVLSIPSANATDSAFADSAAASVFASMDAPALYVGVWDPARGSFVRAYGRAVRGGAAATTDDSFRVASITKTFTATRVLELAQEGMIDLDAQISTYLPQPLASEPKLAHITVRQLLGMESGLADYLVNTKGIAGDIAANPARIWTPQELVDVALGLDADPIGTGGYTNTNYVLLGMVAQQVGGASLSSLISDRLAGPLGLTHTFLPPSDDTALPNPAAHGYLNQECVDKAAAAGATNMDPQLDTTSWNTSYFAGAGGMISTIADLGIWANSDLGTDLLNSDFTKQRLQMHDIGGDGFEYGLGIKRFGDWYGHDGDAFGWDSLALHNPVSGVSFAAAVNACTGYDDSLLDLLQTLYPETSTRS
jgi:D-alanyl-D-alanine carboxypeptidase